MYILSFFRDNGSPKTGLTPTIKIRDVSDGSLLINGASMTEVGDGFYRYDYSAYDSEKDYAIICDGGISLSDYDRYAYAGNESYVDDISNGVLDEQLSEHSITGSLGYVINEGSDDLKRALGLLDENSQLDNQTYNSDGNLLTARKRIYSVAGSVGTNNDVISTYSIVATWSGTTLTSYKMVKV